GLPSRPPPVAPARRSPQPKLTEFGRLTCRVRRPVLPGWIVSARFEDRRVQIHVRPEKIPFRMPPNTVLCGSATASAPTPLEKTAFDFPTLRIKEVLGARCPWQRAYVERVIGSVRRECLDHVIVLDEEGLRRVLASYFSYYHKSRLHLSLDKDSPDPRPIQSIGHNCCDSRSWCPASPVRTARSLTVEQPVSGVALSSSFFAGYTRQFSLA